MDTVINYVASFFTAAPAPSAAAVAPSPESVAAAAPAEPPQKPATPPPQQKDVSICFSRGDTLWVVKLSQVKRMTDMRQLQELRADLITFLLESYSPEDSEDGQIILEEIEKKLSPSDVP